MWKAFGAAIGWINEDQKRGAELHHRFTESRLDKDGAIQMPTTPDVL